MGEDSSTPDLVEEKETPLSSIEKEERNTAIKEPASAKPSDDASQYVTGAKKYALIAGLTMVAFLMMLDGTIVTTVCRKLQNYQEHDHNKI